MPRPTIIACEVLDPGLRLRIFADNAASAAAIYNRIQIHRSTTINGTYTELTDASTRLVLEGTKWVYVYEDTSGTTAKFYKVRYSKSSDGAVLSSFSPPVSGGRVGYISIADVRAAGISDSVADDIVLDLIMGCQSFIEEATGKWFEPREAEYDLDGQDHPFLHLPVPIIAVYALYRNSDFTNKVDATQYKTYSSRSAPDDRRNPKIVLTTSQSYDVFSSPFARMGGMRFVKGEKNQRATGVFGWLERDGSTPMYIRRALTMMVALNAVPGKGIAGSDMSLNTSGQITKRKVDKSEHWYAQPPARSAARPGLLPITRSPEIDAIIAYYTDKYVGMSGAPSLRWM